MWEFEMFKLICTALALSVVTGSSPAGVGTPRFQSDPTPKQEVASAPQSPETAKEPVEIPEEDAPEGELEPAALNLDVSNSSPLIEELYRATRETKEKEILAHIDQAKQLVDTSDLKAVDSHGRTALHWAVFGSSYNIKPSVLVAYEEMADTLIQRGVDINKEDVYQDTALDYLLYSPSFEMQTLLIEHGATSGFLEASTHYVTEMIADDDEVKVRAAALSRKVDLMPGLTLSLRLSGSVYSDRSRTGDPIEATVTYPLCKNGENIACNEGELLVPPGTKVNGTILFAAKAPDKYSRPRLILDFSNVLHKNNQKSPLYARVIDVDNARETIRNNEILGIIQPHASTKVSLAMAALGASNPIAGYTIKGVQTVYGLSIRREIMFPAGTDLQVQIVRPSILKQKEPWDGYRALPIDATLQHLVSSAPMRTASKSKVPSDPTNLMFLGSRKQIVAAFGESGWIQASALGVKSAIKAAQATVRQTGYSDAPVSALLLQDRLPDLVFQKSLDTFAKRHHLRIWKLTDTYLGREVWVGAATHDIATFNSRAGTKWSHRIDPHIDRERDWVEFPARRKLMPMWIVQKRRANWRMPPATILSLTERCRLCCWLVGKRPTRRRLRC
jgi:LssY C-terminus